MIGTTLSHYRIVEQIGAGGMGVVYRAQDTELQRDVAVKVLPKEVINDPSRLERFKREAQTIAKLDHPNILAIHELGTHDRSPFIVTELLEGESLRQCIPSSGMGWQKVAKIGASLADGLAAAHSKGIVHRDLKPENIFITSDGRVKILDFGLAQVKEPVREEAETATLTPAGTVPGTVMGTVGYMSPEQVRGQPADARSDVFALGCVLHEMLTGQITFARETTADTQAAILKEEPPPLTSTGVTLPVELERSITRCLEKSPEARFQSASDLAFALRSITADHSVPPPTPVRRRRSLWAVAAVSTIALGAIVAVLVLGLFNRPAPEIEIQPIRSIALLPLENLTGDPEQAYFVDGLHEELIATFAQISAFDKVIARTSVMAFRDSDTPVREIAQQLKVAAVLEGSVRQAGDTVRVTVQLIDARSESHLWADSFERNLTDILALQSEVARAVAGEVRLALTPEEEQRFTETREVNPESYRAYLRGWRLSTWLATEGDLEKARGRFLQAIEIDPSYAPAYVGLSRTLLQLAHFFRPPNEIMPAAYAAAQKAVELDNGLAAAHSRLGYFKSWWKWDWPGAEAELQRALELSPNHRHASARYAELLAILDRPEEAISIMRRAIQLDPLNLEAHLGLGWVYWLTGEYEQGIEHLRGTLQVFPTNARAQLILSYSYSGAGQHQEAVAAAEMTGKLLPATFENPVYLASLAWMYREVGRAAEARAALGQILKMRETRYVPPTSISMAYYAIGDYDRMYEYLNEAREIHDTQLWMVIGSAIYRQYFGDDPRYQEIRRSMNLPAD